MEFHRRDLIETDCRVKHATTRIYKASKTLRASPNWNCNWKEIKLASAEHVLDLLAMHLPWNSRPSIQSASSLNVIRAEVG